VNDDRCPSILTDVMLEQDEWQVGPFGFMVREITKSLTSELKCASAVLELSYRSERNLKLIKDFYYEV